MALEKLSPQDAAFWKLALANILIENVLCGDFQTVIKQYPILAKIIDKLEPEEVKYITEKIEKLL